MKRAAHALGMWPAAATDRPSKPIRVCPNPKCGAHYSGNTHICRTPRSSR